jgi:NTP pyrophosphatase (non-canonical NTP hydrolase)
MIRDLTLELIEFVRERNWLQFHTPRNMAMTLIVESFELIEHFIENTDKNLDEIKSEIADVMTCILLTRECFGFSILDSLPVFADLQNPAVEYAKKVQKFAEHFLWLRESENFRGDIDEINLKLTDLLKIHLALSHKIDIDPIKATLDKLEKNRKRYPKEIMKNSLESYFIRKKELQK